MQKMVIKVDGEANAELLPEYLVISKAAGKGSKAFGADVKQEAIVLAQDNNALEDNMTVVIFERHPNITSELDPSTGEELSCEVTYNEVEA